MSLSVYDLAIRQVPTRHGELSSSGLYKPAFLPLPIAKEVAGVILELPTDESVLNNEAYKKRGFKKGGKVAIVRVLLYYMRNEN